MSVDCLQHKYESLGHRHGRNFLVWKWFSYLIVPCPQGNLVGSKAGSSTVPVLNCSSQLSDLSVHWDMATQPEQKLNPGVPLSQAHPTLLEQVVSLSLDPCGKTELWVAMWLREGSRAGQETRWSACFTESPLSVGCVSTIITPQTAPPLQLEYSCTTCNGIQ
jgi:hypothetical protein